MSWPAFVKRSRTMAKLGPGAFDRYLAGPEFLERFVALPGSLRRKAIEALVASFAVAAARDSLPAPVTPTKGRGGKPRWTDPAMQQALRDALVWAKGDYAKAARRLGVSTGAAKLAARRYLGAEATSTIKRSA
jgi:hypothetical protein